MSSGRPLLLPETGGLLPEELLHYADGDWYDAEYVHIGGDIPYYESVAREVSGSILELACGTGRLTEPMAKAGATVVGLDIAPSMLARAEKKRLALPPEVQARLTYQHGDMRTARLGRKFDAVVLGFNTLLHLVRDEDLEATLETVRTHLVPEGRFYFDVHTPHFGLLERDPNGRYDPQEMIDPHTGHRYVVTESNRFLAREQVNLLSFHYQRVDKEGASLGPERTITLRLRVLFPRELDRWLQLAGLLVVEEWDDFARGTPFSGRGGRRVAVAGLSPADSL